MKNSILFKFLAILLCAASLTGIVGGTAGVLVLAEGDLYNKTVDQVQDEQLENSAHLVADHTALAYASRELGGCPEDMTQQRYGILPDCDYGYTILDAEGNVLESLKPELKEQANVQAYQFPVAGQYMHLVSTETESEAKAREAAARAELIDRVMADSDGNAIPAEGVSVNQVMFTDALGRVIYEAYGDQSTCHSVFNYTQSTTSSSENHFEAQGRIGFLFRGPDGQIIYHSFLEEWEEGFEDTEICGVMFLSHDDNFAFQTENPDGLGVLTSEAGYLRFTSYPAEETPLETIPETVPETIPETVPETAPEETIVETQAVEETQAEESYDDAEEEYSESAEEPEEQEEEQEEEQAEEEEESSSASAVPEEDSEESSEEEQEEEHSSEEEEETPAETEPPVTTPSETVPPETVVEETIPEETVPLETEPMLINGKPLEFYQVNRTEFHSNTGERVDAKYVYLTLPDMTVEVYLDRSTMSDAEIYDVLRLVRQYRDYLLPAIGICLLVFAVTIVYLCTAAGRKPKNSEICAGGLNRLPLDLYLLLGILVSIGAIALEVEGVPILLGSDFMLGCSFAVSAAFIVCLSITGFCFAFVAQFKTSGGFWWHNLLTVRLAFLCLRQLKCLRVWSFEKGLPALGRWLKKLWNATVTFVLWSYHLCMKGCRWILSSLHRMSCRITAKLNRWFSMMPVMWQWLVTGLAIIAILFLGFALEVQGALIGFALFLVLIIYGAHCFGTLLESTRKMGKGNLNTKVDDKHMIGAFKEFASDLNDLADVAMVAAQKQLKSERMKTELITNVSHDIKTPLTSIINYVDLLQKPHTEEETAQYLEVLDRQSQRLKKLVEDLMDMSKASTGNMVVEITQVDAVESVNQALGEFSDKLERARLYPVFRHSESSVPIMADGKLVWRVLSNLLSNAVKYAMPGTRVYLDLTRVDGNVVISMKNISREELNIDAEELMERFVRGDISRNTEGSGLGLNIAKSLMELQKGQLQLLVDGDLFKVTLIFPDAK